MSAVDLVHRETPPAGNLGHTPLPDIKIADSATAAETTREYMPRLDGIRAVAVLLVLLSHFLGSIFIRWDLGAVGVRVFFVLSGFLITGILLRHRGQPRMQAAVEFYGRRLLRLSPAFYMALIIATVLGYGALRSQWLIHALYLSNVAVFFQGFLLPTGHLWSLAVEEQFYLIWFLVVVCMPERALMPAIWCTLLIGPCYRLAAFLWLKGDHVTANVLLPAVVDSLGAGALLAAAAFGRAGKAGTLVLKLALSRWLLVGAGVLTVLVSIAAKESAFRAVGWQSVLLIFGACLVFSAAQQGRSRMLDWLSIRPLIYIGKISYGIYVYHMFVHYGLSDSLKGVWPPLQAMVLTAATIGIAAASYHLVERRALALKDRISST